jgi:hypothetical protein
MTGYFHIKRPEAIPFFLTSKITKTTAEELSLIAVAIWKARRAEKWNKPYLDDMLQEHKQKNRRIISYSFGGGEILKRNRRRRKREKTRRTLKSSYFGWGGPLIENISPSLNTAHGRHDAGSPISRYAPTSTKSEASRGKLEIFLV